MSTAKKTTASSRVLDAINDAVKRVGSSSTWVTKQEKGSKSLQNVCSGFDIDAVENHMDEDYWLNFWIDTNEMDDAELSSTIDEVMAKLRSSSFYLGTKFPHQSKKDPAKVSFAILDGN